MFYDFLIYVSVVYVIRALYRVSRFMWNRADLVGIPTYNLVNGLLKNLNTQTSDFHCTKFESDLVLPILFLPNKKGREWIACLYVYDVNCVYCLGCKWAYFFIGNIF